MPSYPYKGYAALSVSMGIQLAPYAAAILSLKVPDRMNASDEVLDACLKHSPA